MDSEKSKTPNILYPAYINKARTVAKGRRIPLSAAVVDPKPTEVIDALFALKGFQAQIEQKPYCREPNKEAVNWRVVYHNSNPAKNNLKTKRQTLIACAKRINEIRSRAAPLSEVSKEQKKPKKRA